MTDYHQLERLLTERLWQDADAETARLMWATVHQLRLDETGLSKTDKKHLLRLRYIQEAEITKYPTDELLAIDKLWNDASDGRFSFSAQCRIWWDCYDDELRAIHEATKVWSSRQYQRFAEKVGWVGETDWLPYSGIWFDINAPKGHLPAAPFYAEEIATGWVATLVEKF